ncbi:unnamed protein product [Rotaria socialis]
MTSYSAVKRQPKTSATSRSISQFQVTLEHVLGFTSISSSVVSQNHSTIAYAAGCTVILYDRSTQKQDFVINTTRKTIKSLSISPDGRYLATGESGHDPKVRIWDLAGDRNSCIELGDHQFSIDHVCFSPKINYLVSIGSSHDGYIYVWNWQHKKKLTSNKCLCSIHRIAFAADGSYFVTVGIRHVKFWYFTAKSLLDAVPLRGHDAILGELKNNIFTDVVCGRGNCTGSTYTSTANGLIFQFDEHRKLRANRNLQKKINCLAISDSYLVVGCVQGVIYILSAQILESVMSVPLPHCLGVDTGLITSINQMAHSQQPNISFPDTIAVCLDEDKSLLTCFYNDHSFYIWDIKNERSIEKRVSHLYHSGCGWGIETYAWTSASPSIFRPLTFITCSSDNTVRFWSLNHDETDSNFTSSQAANRVGRELMKIVYLEEDYSKLCDSPRTQERSESSPKPGGRCIKMSPDGLSLAIGDLIGNIRIFDIQTFKQIQLIEAHESEVLSVDYGQSSDMNVTFLASCSRDRLLHIFDASRDYQLVTTLVDHSGIVTAVRFTFSSIASNLQLISCSADKSLIIRSISKNENGKYQFLRSHNIFEKQTFHDLTVDHSHELIYTACQDRMIRVYNTQSGKRVRIGKGSIGDDNGYLTKIDIDASGRYLATSSTNKYVYLWDTKTSECVASLCGHGDIVTDLKFSHDGRHLYTTAGDSCIFVWNIEELGVAPSSCRLTSSATEEHQLQSSSPQSLLATPEPGLPQLGTELPDSQIFSSSDKMIFLQDDESAFSNEDNHTTSAEKVNSFFTTNYDHEEPTVNTAVDGTVSKHKLERQNSVSFRFRLQSQDTAESDTLSIPINTIQEDVLVATSTIDDMGTKVVPPRSPTNPQTCDNELESKGHLCSSTTSLNKITGNTTSSASLSHSYVPSYATSATSSTSQICEEFPTPGHLATSLEKQQYPQSTDDLRTCTLNGNDHNLTEIKLQRSLSIPEPLINEPNDPIINDDRMFTVNHLANDLHKSLDELENLYGSLINDFSGTFYTGQTQPWKTEINDTRSQVHVKPNISGLWQTSSASFTKSNVALPNSKQTHSLLNYTDLVANTSTLQSVSSSNTSLFLDCEENVEFSKTKNTILTFLDNEVLTKPLQQKETKIKCKPVHSYLVDYNDYYQLIFLGDEIDCDDRFKYLTKDIKYCYTAVDCIEEIVSVKSKLTLVVLSGAYVNDEKVYNHLKCITDEKCIYKLTLTSEMDEKHQFNDINNGKNHVCQLIEKNIQNYYSNKATFCLLPSVKEKEKLTARDLTAEQANFIWTKMYFENVLHLSTMKCSADKTVSYSRLHYHGHLHMLNSVQEFARTYETVKNALAWYSPNTFIYPLVNEAISRQNIEMIFALGSFLGDLQDNIIKIKPEHVTTPIYWHQNVSIDDLENMEKNIGGLIGVNSYIWATENPSIEPTSRTSVLFQLECKTAKKFNCKIIIEPGSVFRIESIHKLADSRMSCICLVQDQTYNPLTVVKEEIGSLDSLSAPGEFLVWTNQFENAKNYYEEIVSRFPRRFSVHNYLAYIYMEFGMHFKAIEHYESAIQILECQQQTYLKEKEQLDVFLHLGQLYSTIGKNREALHHLEKALKVISLRFPLDNVSMGTCDNLIGLIYNSLGDHSKAREHMENGLRFHLSSLPSNHSITAMSYFNAGYVYRHMGEYELALKCFTKALEISLKILPANHRQLVPIYHNLGLAFHHTAKYENALENYQKELTVLCCHPYITDSMKISDIHHLLNSLSENLSPIAKTNALNMQHKCLSVIKANNDEFKATVDPVNKLVNDSQLIHQVADKPKPVLQEQTFEPVMINTV